MPDSAGAPVLKTNVQLISIKTGRVAWAGTEVVATEAIGDAGGGRGFSYGVLNALGDVGFIKGPK